VDRDRCVVSDAVWEKVASLLPGKASDPGATGKDNRLFLEAVLWRVRTGVFDRIFERLSDAPDFEYALIDGTIVSVHQKASGAKGGLKIRPSAAPKVG
jgi:transposase